ncbi:MAG TPA: hypothetical protein VHB77_09140 [Planctomycetaceae bacterium]|nr:hypothetical protein [Planctomycetaceae bacterium]
MSLSVPPRMSVRCGLASRLLRALGIAVALGIAGCFNGEKGPKTVEQPFKGQTVRIAAPADLGLQAPWDVPLNEWAARTGGAFEFRPVKTADGAFPPQAEADVAVLPLTSLGAWRGEEALASIPSTAQGETHLHWKDYFQGLRENLAPGVGGPACVPLAAPVLICYYRADLLQAANLKPPETWDDYHQLVADLPKWAPGLTAVEPWNDDWRATLFLARSVGYARHSGHYSLYFDAETGAPLIDSPGFQRGLDISLKILPLLSADSRKFGVSECRGEILAGRAALAIALETGPSNPRLPFGPDSGEAKTPEEVERSKDVGLGFCQLPGAAAVYNPTLASWEELGQSGVNRVTLTGFGGLALGVSSHSSEQTAQAGWNLVESLTSEQENVPFPPGVRGLVRESDLQQPDRWVGKALTGSEAGRYCAAAAKSLRDRHLVVELPVLGRSGFRKALTEELARAFEAEADSSAILEEVAAKWRKIAEQLGPDKVRDSYRRSLGLTAR